MENNFITSTSLLQSIVGESSAESEIILPDYCPPVMKIVRTDATAMIRSQSIRGDRVLLRVLWISKYAILLKVTPRQSLFFTRHLFHIRLKSNHRNHRKYYRERILHIIIHAR